MYRLLKRRVVFPAVVLGVLVGAASITAAAFHGNAGPVTKVVGAAPARADGSDTTAYEKCLNEHGWPVGPGLSIDTTGNAPEPGVIEAAVAACKDLENGVLAALQPSESSLQELADRSDRFAGCMSNHGVGVGAPHVFRGKAGIGVNFPGYDPSANGFDSAYAACKSIMDAFG